MARSSAKHLQLQLPLCPESTYTWIITQKPMTMDKAFEKREIEERRGGIPIIRKVSANPIEAAATPRKTASGRMCSMAPAVSPRSRGRGVRL